jgi:hypothetical protein
MLLFFPSAQETHQGTGGIGASAIGTLKGSHQMITHEYLTPGGTVKVYDCAPLLPRMFAIRSGCPVLGLLVVLM